MDKAVKVTVGIPFYNAGKYFALAIQSIINQSYKNWELILVNDGSTDDSLKIAMSFTDPRIRVMHDNTNRGISFRLNQIIAEAKGQYIARMDADDLAFPDRLKEQVDMFERDPRLDIVDSEAVIIHEHNEVIGKRAVRYDFTSIRQTFGSVRFIHPTVMFRKSFIEKFLYNSEFDGAEDRDLWIRCYETAHVGKIPYPLYFYRESNRLNIKTYHNRCSQLVKLFKAHIEKITPFFYYTLIFKIRIKELIYTILHVFNMDVLLLRRRNMILQYDEMNFYASQLQKAIHFD